MKSLNHTAGKMDVDILTPKDADATSISIKKSIKFEVNNSRDSMQPLVALESKKKQQSK